MVREEMEWAGSLLLAFILRVMHWAVWGLQVQALRLCILRFRDNEPLPESKSAPKTEGNVGAWAVRDEKPRVWRHSLPPSSILPWSEQWGCLSSDGPFCSSPLNDYAGNDSLPTPPKKAFIFRKYKIFMPQKKKTKKQKKTNLLLKLYNSFG